MCRVRAHRDDDDARETVTREERTNEQGSLSERRKVRVATESSIRADSVDSRARVTHSFIHSFIHSIHGCLGPGGAMRGDV